MEYKKLKQIDGTVWMVGIYTDGEYVERIFSMEKSSRRYYIVECENSWFEIVPTSVLWAKY